jgi:hypothetical protein
MLLSPMRMSLHQEYFSQTRAVTGGRHSGQTQWAEAGGRGRGQRHGAETRGRDRGKYIGFASGCAQILRLHQCPTSLS